MDIQRIVLIGALAVISYLLVLQWQQDYGNQQPVASETASQPQAPGGSQPAPGAQESTGESPGGADDIPSAEPRDRTTSSGLGDDTKDTSDNLVRVTTDTLEILIDPQGGDIIEARLPRHLALLSQDAPLVLLEQNAVRTYVAQSGITGRDGPDADGKRPQYQAEQMAYELGPDANELEVALQLTQDNGTRITKRFHFTRDEYQVRVSYEVSNQGNASWHGNFFGQIKRDNSADPSSQTSMGMQSYLGPAFSTTENNYLKYSFDDIDDQRFAQKSQGGWVAMLQHYFVSAWVPDRQATNSYYARGSDGIYRVGFVAPTLEVPPGETATTSAHLYVGPKVQERLETIAPNLELTVDFGWLWWIASPLFWLLKAFHNLVGNWGVAIILVTVVVKTLFFHLSAKAYRSMAKMRAVAPELTRLKELYGDDRQKMSQEMMKLYQKEKINPLGGCLPILVQMPVFIALYWVLLESVELRHAPFMLWINDLSVMDPYFVLPILMGVTMFVQQLLNPTPPDPMQAKVMKMLPFVFTFFFLWFPAGLVLYWLVNNLLSILQQWLITRKIEAETASRRH